MKILRYPICIVVISIVPILALKALSGASGEVKVDGATAFSVNNEPRPVGKVSGASASYSMSRIGLGSFDKNQSAV